MSRPVSIAVHGASGRMGQAVLRLALGSMETSVVAALVRPDAPLAGKPLRDAFGDAAGDLRYSTSLDAKIAPAVLIDFGSPHAFEGALAIAIARRIAFVSGTTGLTPAQHAAMKKAAATIPVLWGANFSLGIAVLARLSRQAARALAAWDCEIAEAHHRNKKDAPSGTALALGRAIADARGVEFDRVAEPDRMTTPRGDASSIGFAVSRSGDTVGEHTVVFAAAGERIELVHRATDRDIFARGALTAAAWIADRPAGLHVLADVLGLGRD